MRNKTGLKRFFVCGWVMGEKKETSSGAGPDESLLCMGSDRGGGAFIPAWVRERKRGRERRR